MAILLLVIAGVCAAAADMVFPLPGRPDLLIALVLAWSLRRDPTTSCIGAACLGFIGDMASDGRLGVETALFGSVAFAVSTIRDRWQLSWVAQSVVTLFAATVLIACLTHAVSVTCLTTSMLALFAATIAARLPASRLRYAS